MAEAYLHHSQNDHLNLDGPFNIANVVHKYFFSYFQNRKRKVKNIQMYKEVKKTTRKTLELVHFKNISILI